MTERTAYMSPLGPNTNAPADLLSPKVILVCGEDRRTLLPYTADTPSHAYRCFEFWKLPDYTLILCGMGTGCVEPLTWEITRPKIVRQIVLVGSAGKMPGAAAKIGHTYQIAEAWLAGTALDGEHLREPFHPRWPGAEGVSSVSTDFFYGFAPRILQNGYPLGKGALAKRYAQHLARGTQLVDMEVAPFYCFCDKFGDSELQYLAIKGVSNELGADDQQIAETDVVIQRVMSDAARTLGLESAARLSAQSKST